MHCGCEREDYTKLLYISGSVRSIHVLLFISFVCLAIVAVELY